MCLGLWIFVKNSAITNLTQIDIEIEQLVQDSFAYKEFLLSDTDRINKGKKLYLMHCGTCHGWEERKNFSTERGMVPPPRNFWNPKEVLRYGKSPIAIYTSITRGRLGSTMPPFHKRLTHEQRRDLTHYVISIMNSVIIDTSNNNQKERN